MVVRYKENPHLNKKIVKTVEGENEYVKNCKKIDGRYYSIGNECIQVEGKWKVVTDSSISLDYETGNYFNNEKKGRRIYGVVNIKEEKPMYGFFSPNIAKNVKFVDSEKQSMVVAINDDIFKDNKKYIENLSEGVWYCYDCVNKDVLKKCKTIYNIHDWTLKKYSIEENTSEFLQKIKSYDAYNHPIEEWTKKYGKFLKYSIGVEFETSHGYVPEHMQYRHGIVPVRDGSLSGGQAAGGGMEAVTIPLIGEKGLSSIKQLCEYMKSRVMLDLHCSTHVHLGGYSTEKNKIIALYLLCYRIQDEIFDTLPPYKRYWEGFKRRNYCKELDSLGIVQPIITDKDSFSKYIHRCYSQIFSFASDFKKEIDSYSKGDRHPSGEKWNIENRKTWINFVNIFFSNRETIEFRPLQATFSDVKIINWIFIYNSILLYADLHTNELLTSNKKIKLAEVLSVYTNLDVQDKDGSFLSKYLIEFVNSRKIEFAAAFKRGKKERSEFACQWDLDGDKDYNFLIGDKNLFIS